ncbi:MAG: lamin tail domain-containing protein, partial [Dehalococcoidia bacterium]|nr:lamin tail domain-containing protein [Dehalococcoidia bacterium]
MSAPAVVGLALQLESSAPATLSQVVTAVAGGDYAASLSAQVEGGAGRVTLRLRFLDSGFLPVGLAVQTSAFPGASFSSLELQTTAPPGSSWAKIESQVDPDPGPPLAVVLDEARLTETLPPPATPSPPATTGGSPSAGETRTPTPTPTATARATVTASSSGQDRLPTRKGVAPTMPRPALVPTPATDGNLLANGGFELGDGDGPAFWEKYGGELVFEDEAFEGVLAASFLSNSDSTKWVHQALIVTSGGWYSGSAQARVTAGAADVFLRISWYRAQDGSGEAISEDDSLVATSARWTLLTVGPVRAPEDARSARFRLMLRPFGPASALFDAARLAAAAAEPPVTPATPPAPPAGTTVPASPRPAGSATTQATPTVTPRPPAVGSGLRRVEGGLRISEVCSDPAESGRDSDYEWVELVNVGRAPVELAGWLLGDSKTISALPAAAVPPGAYVVVAATAAARRVPGALAIEGGTVGGGLNNAGDTVRLLNPAGAEVDAVSYGDDASVFDRPPPAPGPGESLGLRDPLGPGGGEEWALT